MDKIKFNEKDHTYKLIKDNGNEIDLISVTTLLKRHGISPDYSDVNEYVLKAKAERGKVIHKELERYINHKEIGFTGELEAFIEVCFANNILPSKSEFMVWNDELAGTVDVAGIIDGKTFIGDFKTTATLHLEAVAWQLSIYAYLMKEKFDKYICFYFPDEHTCKLVEIEPIPNIEIEKLLECERNCEKYTKPLLPVEKTINNKIEIFKDKLWQLKRLKDEEKALKDELIELMENAKIKSFENDYLKISYTAPTIRTDFDKEKFKLERPKIFEKYLKLTPISASVRITLKD